MHGLGTGFNCKYALEEAPEDALDNESTLAGMLIIDAVVCRLVADNCQNRAKSARRKVPRAQQEGDGLLEPGIVLTERLSNAVEIAMIMGSLKGTELFWAEKCKAGLKRVREHQF